MSPPTSFDAVWRPYTQMQTAPAPLVAARTEGSRIHLDDGRCLIDGIASWWTACHGYNHPAIRAAVAAQLETMPHVMLGGLIHGPVVELAERLTDILPGDLKHFFFSESGSVAVEIAMKIARQYWINHGQRERQRFVCFRDAYHGDTFAAMSVCDPEDSMHSLFAGVIAEQLVCTVPRDEAGFAAFDAALAAESDTLAALIIEPLVQCAGGFKLHGAAVLERIVATARRHGLLVIFDEIATGFGRTGSMFAADEAGVVPDIMTLSKALTGGTMALAVTAATGRVYEAFLGDDPKRALMHGPTYCGNALACSAANASLELFRTEPRLEQVAAIAERMRDGLAASADVPGVADVRVKGAIGVVELAGPVDLDGLRQRFVECGVWIRPFGNVVYLMPALNIPSADLDTLIAAITDVIAERGKKI
ncbi:MAG: adenosylmethionine--8-amino-7-oxononanoate transaminase [Gammaproteobacteria bacterium]|nr:adenosylmethionine--8-amino-7-oxononanoate transaminase [Gammaproteobacteria bacterium]